MISICAQLCFIIVLYCVGALKGTTVIQIGCIIGSICSMLAHYEYKSVMTRVVGSTYNKCFGRGNPLQQPCRELQYTEAHGRLVALQSAVSKTLQV